MTKVTFNYFEKGVFLEDCITFNSKEEAKQFITEKVNKPFMKITID